jgi:hypothetical protein
VALRTVNVILAHLLYHFGGTANPDNADILIIGLSS